MQNCLIFYAKLSHFLCKIVSFFMQNCLIFYAKLSHFLRKIVSFFMQNCLIFYAKLSHFLCKIVSFFTQNCLIFYAKLSHFLCKIVSFFTQNCLIFYAKLSHFLCKHLYSWYRLSTTSAGLSKINVDGTKAWIASFPFNPIMKSLSIDSSEQYLYLGSFTSSLVVLRLSTANGSIASQQSL